MITVPEGYARTTVRGVLLIARQDLLEFAEAAVLDAGSLYAFAQRHPRAQPLAGRGTAYCVPVADGSWVVRHYFRGGAVASWLGDRYLRGTEPRSVQELQASEAARRRGIPTPQVLAATVHPSGLFQRGDIATRLVPDALDLAAVSFGPARWSEAERVAAWAAAGALVRDVACAGILHADLNLKNILISGTPPSIQAWLIDLDRCRLRQRPTLRDLERMAVRVQRSGDKIQALSGERLGRAELLAFAEGLRG